MGNIDASPQALLKGMDVLSKDNGSVIDKYLSFSSSGKSYGVAISKIKEIIEYCSITKVPTAPGFIHGVINLRGCVVPVINLAERLGFKQRDIAKKTCIVIFDIELDDVTFDVGVLVDEVNEVIDIENDLLEQAPSFGLNIRADFISAMGKVSDDFIVLLDIQKVLNPEEIAVANKRSETELESVE